MTSSSDLDGPQQLVARITAEAEDTNDQPMPAGFLPTKPNKSVTVSTRLTPKDLADIEALAERLDIPLSALLRGWILTGLSATANETVTSALDRLSADVQRLRELLA
ncbi:MAG: hypothetical protein ACR2K2_11930 [Mycobacteriales bacterium]